MHKTFVISRILIYKKNKPASQSEFENCTKQFTLKLLKFVTIKLKIMRLSSFLCFELETGGKIVAWWTFIICIPDFAGWCKNDFCKMIKNDQNSIYQFRTLAGHLNLFFLRLGMIRYGFFVAILSIPILIGYFISCEFISDQFNNYGVYNKLLEACYIAKTCKY